MFPTTPFHDFFVKTNEKTTPLLQRSKSNKKLHPLLFSAILRLLWKLPFSHFWASVLKPWFLIRERGRLGHFRGQLIPVPISKLSIVFKKSVSYILSLNRRPKHVSDHPILRFLCKNQWKNYTFCSKGRNPIKNYTLCYFLQFWGCSGSYLFQCSASAQPATKTTQQALPTIVTSPRPIQNGSTDALCKPIFPNNFLLLHLR